MAEFNYQAIDSAGKRSAGSVTAGTDREAAAMLDSQGLYPIAIVPGKAGVATGRGGKKVRASIMTRFYSQLSDLLRTGVPMLRALDILERQSTNLTLKACLTEIRGKVANGVTLADAMKPYPNVFNELSVSMVKAGQEGGFMEDVLKRIADFTEKADDLKGKVIGALAYPVFLSITGVVVLAILILGFVPRFEPIFAKLKEKGELPGLTIGLLGVRHFALDYWYILIGMGALSWFGWKAWTSSESGRSTLDTIRLKFPGAGRIYLDLALSRFTRVLGTLLKNGIPILQSLQIAKDSTGNRVLTAAIQKSAENITAGNKLAAPLAECKYIPRDVVEMISIAEESNSLETVLVDISESLEKRSTRQLELFVKLLEPVMLLVMAVITLLVVAGLLLPVFKMSSAVK